MPEIFSSYMFWFMSGHIFLLLFLLFKNKKHLINEFRKINWKIWVLLFVIFLFGFYLRNSEYWRGPFSDGYFSEDSAQIWINYGEDGLTCMSGTTNDCDLFSRILSPPGHPYLIALVHLIFGVNTLNASIISAVLSSLTIILVFLIAQIIFKHEKVSLSAAFIFSLIPLNIVQSQTGLTRPTGLFFVGLTILAYFLALRSNKLISWFLVAITFSYSIYVRQENYIILPSIVLFFIWIKFADIRNLISNNKKALFRYSLIGFLVFIFFIFWQLPLLNWLLFNNPFQVHSIEGMLWGLHPGGILIQAKAMIAQMFNQSPLWPSGVFHFNLFISVIFFFSFFALLFSRNKKFYFLLSIWLAYFFIYSLMFDGMLYGHDQLTHSYVRRSFMLGIPYAIIAAYGFYFYNPWRLAPDKYKKRISCFLLANCFFWVILFFVGVSASQMLQNINKKILLNYVSFYFPKHIFYNANKDKKVSAGLGQNYSEYWSVIEQLPENCAVITYYNLLPIDTMFKEKKLQAVNIGMIQEERIDLFNEKFSQESCIVYLEDCYCLTPNYVYWQNYNYPCWYMENKFKKNLLFKENNINVYEVEFII